jgi:hypothetical protein
VADPTSHSPLLVAINRPCIAPTPNYWPVVQEIARFFSSITASKGSAFGHCAEPCHSRSEFLLENADLSA